MVLLELLPSSCDVRFVFYPTATGITRGDDSWEEECSWGMSASSAPSVKYVLLQFTARRERRKSDHSDISASTVNLVVTLLRTS